MARMRVAMKVTRLLFVSSPSGGSLGKRTRRPILRALRYSSHARSIELALAGRGPTERALRAQASALLSDGVITRPVRFAFMSAPELAREASRCDLYVHAARIEVEG